MGDLLMKPHNSDEPSGPLWASAVETEAGPVESAVAVLSMPPSGCIEALRSASSFSFNASFFMYRFTDTLLPIHNYGRLGSVFSFFRRGFGFFVTLRFHFLN